MNGLRLTGLALFALSLAMVACTPKVATPCSADTANGQTCTPSYIPGSSLPGEPTPNESTLPPGTGAYSDAGIDILGGSLAVKVTDGSAHPIAGATLRLYGPTMATTTVDATGMATLGPLAVGSGYRLIVSANNYATVQQDGIAIAKNAATNQNATLGAQAIASGTITGGGKPIEGATVSDGLNSALTDASGNYTLAGIAQGTGTLSASKTGFHTASKAIAASGTVSGQNLDLTATTPVVYFDQTVPPGLDLAHMSMLQSALTSAGWQVTTTPPASDGVWVLVSPSKALPQALVTRIISFVAQGGKLVLFGEWGGYGSFNNPSMDNLAHAVGLHFNPDLLRDPTDNPAHPEWLTIDTFAPKVPSLANVKALKLYSACSLFGLAPMSAWAQSSTSGYRVQDNAATGQEPVVMAGPFKGGKAIALADTSGFSDDDTEGNGTPDIKQANNLELVNQVFNW